MSSIYKARDEIQKLVYELIKKNHADLAAEGVSVVFFFNEKTSKANPYGKASKATPMQQALSDEPLDFILEFPAEVWTDQLTTRQKEAAVDDLLCRCRADYDEKSGEHKLKLAKPDLMIFRENFERYGLWQPQPDQDEESETLGGPDAGLINALEDLQGVEAPDSSEEDSEDSDVPDSSEDSVEG